MRWGRVFAAGGSGLVAIVAFHRDRFVAHTSWTTDSKPSVPWEHNWDRRQPENLIHPRLQGGSDEEKNSKLESVRPKFNRHIFLIRHGQYNQDGDDDKLHTLTKLGREQADFTGRRLKELSGKLGISAYTVLIHSSMTRAQETARIVSEHLPETPVRQCEIIHEGSPIPPEPPVGHWRPQLRQFYQDGPRIEAAFRKHFHRADEHQEAHSYEILVCHANVIRYFLCRALQFPPEAWLRFGMYNGSVTWITVRPNGRVVVHFVGDAGHIPADKLSTS